MKGLPFNLDMARAWHEGRKTVTRRLMKQQPEPHHWEALPSHRLHHAVFSTSDGLCCKFWHTIVENDLPDGEQWVKPRYQPGEVVFVQEPWFFEGANSFDAEPGMDVLYQASTGMAAKWRSPITMPEWASRSKARIVDVRVEQVQEITEDECFREGIEPTSQMLVDDDLAIDRFERLWETLYPGSWSRNDYVWRYGLEMVEK